MTWLSIGCAIVASTMAAEAPGYSVVTDTCGGTISGYCATGITTSDSSPAMVVTMAMTVASRGRSMKIAENMPQPWLCGNDTGAAITGVPGRRVSMPCTTT